MTGKNLCRDCHLCCETQFVRVYKEDIDRWKKEQRYDIILCLENWFADNAIIIHKPEGGCIFLTKDGCEIYNTRPKVCKEFPKSKRHAEKIGCKLKDAF